MNGMKPLAVLVAVSFISVGCAVLIAGRRISLEIFFGMLGPLAATAGTWVVVCRAYRAAPESTTAVMVAGLFLKMIFFGAYVAVMLKVVDLRPAPFVASFTTYFIGLYLIEAFYLKSLFSRRSR